MKGSLVYMLPLVATLVLFSWQTDRAMGKRLMHMNGASHDLRRGETSTSATAEIHLNTAKGRQQQKKKEESGMELFPTGSSLPDCAHACGPCFPCRRVMVSFRCPMSESCPVVYRCMCRGKYYQVPSN